MKILAFLAVLVSLCCSHFIAYRLGEAAVKDSTRVVFFDMRKGLYGPYFGVCRVMSETADACATNVLEVVGEAQ
jgi:hypothetical protein